MRYSASSRTNGPSPIPGTLPLSRGVLNARAVLDRRTIQSPICRPKGRSTPREVTLRYALAYAPRLTVPLIQAGEAIGVINIRRDEVRPFADREIDLLKTFADQAVIAIENTRLFEEVQARTTELQESLEYQTATGDVLSVISRSPNELQPVLEAIVETAQRLCQSDRALFFQLRDGRYHLAAERGTDPEFLAWLREHPMSPEPGSGSTVGQAARSGVRSTFPMWRPNPNITRVPFRDGGGHVRN